MRTGNYLKHAYWTGRGYVIELHVAAEDEDAYRRAMEIVKAMGEAGNAESSATENS